MTEESRELVPTTPAHLLERTPEQRRKLIELSEALKLMAHDQQDHRIALWLEDVVERVNRYADAPTRDQMAGALGAAEITVHSRLDEILGAIDKLAQAGNQRGLAIQDASAQVGALSSQFQSLAESVDDLANEVKRMRQSIGKLDKRVKRTEERLDGQSELLNEAARERETLVQQINALGRTVEELSRRFIAQDPDQARRFAELLDRHEAFFKSYEQGGHSDVGT